MRNVLQEASGCQATAALPARRRACDCGWLKHVYPVPGEFRSLEERIQYQHGDLARFSRAELLRELERVRLRVLLAPDRDPDLDWLEERLGHVEFALRG